MLLVAGQHVACISATCIPLYPATDGQQTGNNFGVDKWVVSCNQIAAISSQWWRRLVNAYEVKAGVVCLQCKNCVIDTWALQRRASHNGALYKFSFLSWRQREYFRLTLYFTDSRDCALVVGITLECLATWSDDVTSTSYVIARHRHANVIDCFVRHISIICYCYFTISYSCYVHCLAWSQWRDFGLKSGGTNSEGERGALGSRDEREENWEEISLLFNSGVWASFVSSPSVVRGRVLAENGFIVI